MKQKRITAGVFAILILVGGYFAIQGNIAQAVQVPDQINLWIDGVVFAAVTAGLAWLFQWIGLDFRGYADQIAGVLSAWIVLELQNIVNLIPAAYDPYVSFIFQVLLIILGGIGTLNILAMFRSQRTLLPK